MSDVIEQTQRSSADRPLISLRDFDLRDLLFSNTNGFSIVQNNGQLSLIGTSAGGQPGGNLGGLSPAAGGPGNLGNLSPSAGGNNLGNLSPSAGGIQGDQNVTCANAYLDGEFALPPEKRTCQMGGGQRPSDI